MSDTHHSLVVAGAQALVAPQSATSMALAERAKADALARWQMALMRPRDLDQVRHDLLKECQRPTFAEQAEYRLEFGKTAVTGPSIRLAEAAARAMGHVHSEAVIVAEAEDAVTVQVTVTDVQNNASWSQAVTVRKLLERRELRRGQHSVGTRTNADGRTVYLVAVSDQEMLRNVNAQISRVKRTLLLRVLPGDLLDDAIAACRATRARHDKADPQAQQKRVADAFAGLGVTPAQLAEYLGHPLAQCSPAQLDELRAIYASIKDGEARWSDYARSDDIEEQSSACTTAQMREKLRARRAKATEDAHDPEPRTGQAPSGMKWTEWTLHGDTWRGRWAIADEDLAGVVECRPGGVAVEHVDGEEVSAEDLAWAWRAQ